MKYAVIHPRLGATHVAASYRWAWLARLFAAAYKLRHPAIEGVEIVAVTQDPQEIINICEHRDQAINERAIATQAELHAIEALYPLVARDDAGHWTTVHAADMPVGENTAALLDRVFA